MKCAIVRASPGIPALRGENGEATSSRYGAVAIRVSPEANELFSRCVSTLEAVSVVAELRREHVRLRLNTPPA